MHLGPAAAASKAAAAGARASSRSSPVAAAARRSSSSSSSPPPPAPAAADAKAARRAARAVPLRVVHVSKPSGASPGLELAAEEWLAKLRRHAPESDVVCVRPSGSSSGGGGGGGGGGGNTTNADADAERVLRHITPSDRVVLLDERGKSLTSPQLARMLAKAGDDSVARLVFLVGGAYGHGAAARARADEMVKLSDLTLNHAVARVVLLEALYRGWAILRGDPYHHV
jgi:23S rRNA (pseudouridine1915-N3)-methyltransferase